MDLKSLRMVCIAIAMCVFMAMIISHAFKYLPENTESMRTPISVEDINSHREGDEEQTAEELRERIKTLEEELEHSNRAKEDAENRVSQMERVRTDEPFHEIPEQNHDESEFAMVYGNAEKEFSAKSYEKALVFYQNALQIAESDKQRADCYLGLSKVYAIQQRFGSAISNAQKAHNIKPSYESAVMLAKLNHRTGNPARATQSMKTLIERDFSLDF